MHARSSPTLNRGDLHTSPRYTLNRCLDWTRKISAAMQRDWSAPERLARSARAQMPRAAKVRMAIELYEAARASVPGWPSDAQRRADLDHHMKLKALMNKASHVGAR